MRQWRHKVDLGVVRLRQSDASGLPRGGECGLGRMWIGAVRDSGANPILGCKSNYLEGGGASNLTGADRGRVIGAVSPASRSGQCGRY